jgi:hypothetical protein
MVVVMRMFSSRVLLRRLRSGQPGLCREVVRSKGADVLGILQPDADRIESLSRPPGAKSWNILIEIHLTPRAPAVCRGGVGAALSAARAS